MNTIDKMKKPVVGGYAHQYHKPWRKHNRLDVRIIGVRQWWDDLKYHSFFLAEQEKLKKTGEWSKIGMAYDWITDPSDDHGWCQDFASSDLYDVVEEKPVETGFLEEPVSQEPTIAIVPAIPYWNILYEFLRKIEPLKNNYDKGLNEEIAKKVAGRLKIWDQNERKETANTITTSDGTRIPLPDGEVSPTAFIISEKVASRAYEVIVRNPGNLVHPTEIEEMIADLKKYGRQEFWKRFKERQKESNDLIPSFVLHFGEWLFGSNSESPYAIVMFYHVYTLPRDGLDLALGVLTMKSGYYKTIRKSYSFGEVTYRIEGYYAKKQGAWLRDIAPYCGVRIPSDGPKARKPCPEGRTA